MKNVKLLDSIDKRESITHKEFVQHYVKNQIPVVFKNASSAWKSNTIFSPEFFKKNFGEYETWLGDRKYTMAEVLEVTANSSRENPAPYPILFDIPEQIPELLEMLNPVHMNYSQPNWFRSSILPYGKFGNNIQLFIGGPGNQYGLHKDLFHTNAWITQLYGEKKFVLFPGDQDEFLYGQENGNLLSPIDITSPDYIKYPKFKNAKALEIILKPRETIYIPNGVWHTTVAHEHNISLIFDQLNGSNFQSWCNDMYEYKKDSSKIKAINSYVYAMCLATFCKTAQLMGKKF